MTPRSRAAAVVRLRLWGGILALLCAQGVLPGCSAGWQLVDPEPPHASKRLAKRATISRGVWSPTPLEAKVCSERASYPFDLLSTISAEERDAVWRLVETPPMAVCRPYGLMTIALLGSEGSFEMLRAHIEAPSPAVLKHDEYVGRYSALSAIGAYRGRHPEAADADVALQYLLDGTDPDFWSKGRITWTYKGQRTPGAVGRMMAQSATRALAYTRADTAIEKLESLAKQSPVLGVRQQALESVVVARRVRQNGISDMSVRGEIRR